MAKTGLSTSDNSRHSHSKKWIHCPNPSLINCVCLGSGRFLRSVLVPALQHRDDSTIVDNEVDNCDHHLRALIVQTRGLSFLEHISSLVDPNPKESENIDRNCSASDSVCSSNYEIDTCGYDGTVSTERIECYGAGSMGTKEHKAAALDIIRKCSHPIKLIGVGVTEAGLSSSSNQCMIDLVDILECIYLGAAIADCDAKIRKRHKLSVINTDNVPNNGDVIKSHVMKILITNSMRREGIISLDGERNDGEFQKWIKDNVTFHNSMVDRITSSREGSGGMVPFCEPVPKKALVIEDVNNNLPEQLSSTARSKILLEKFGVVIRTNSKALHADINLKLRVANGTHTALAQTMALSSIVNTAALSPPTTIASSSEAAYNDSDTGIATLLMNYCDSFFYTQILPAAASAFGACETKAVYDDWRCRLTHPKFGLGTFFIAQNCAAKGGIRLGPTVRDLLVAGKEVNATTVFAFSSLLRFLTPLSPSSSCMDKDMKCKGWLDKTGTRAIDEPKNDIVNYADSMSYNLKDGAYDFKCSCTINIGNSTCFLVDALKAATLSAQKPCEYRATIMAYLLSSSGGNMADCADLPQFGTFVDAVCTLYSQMISGDSILNILIEQQ